jgi:hypothetical protein
MDSRVLKSLATCALMQCAPDPNSGGIGFEDSTGAQCPDLLASNVIGAGVRDGEFCLGFETALEIAAAVTDDPTRVADIQGIIEKAKRELREMQREAA